jgi:hypothetical protein
MLDAVPDVSQRDTKAHLTLMEGNDHTCYCF